MHAFIRKTIENKYSSDLSADVSILYGGSVNQPTQKRFSQKKMLMVG